MPIRKVRKNKEEEARIQSLMEEGYREMAEKNLRIAEQAFPQFVGESLKSTRWDETSSGQKWKMGA